MDGGILESAGCQDDEVMATVGDGRTSNDDGADEQIQMKKYIYDHTVRQRGQLCGKMKLTVFYPVAGGKFFRDSSY